MHYVRYLAPLLRVATPAAGGALGLWLATAAPDVYRAVCGG